jgi:hypothetical protein
MLEYVWTRSFIREEETPPGPGWEYYGGCIRGTREDPTASVWRLTRWAKKEGDTTKFEHITTRPKGRNSALALLQPKNNFLDQKEIGTGFACVTSQVTVTPIVTPPTTVIKPKGLAWALQLLRV